MKKQSIFTTIAAFSILSAQSAVVVGDLAVVGYQADGTDRFWILALNDLSMGETFSFTDNGWLNSGSFRSGEGHKVYTISADLGVGEILEVGVSEGSGSAPNFAAGGDQLFIYTGTVASPNFVYGLNNEGSGVWQADAANSNTSALPPSLIEGESAVALNEVDNAAFDFDSNPGPFTAAEWLAAIGDNTNWIGDNTTEQVPTVSSVVVTIPEPSTALLSCIALLGLLRRRR